jgi:hypothetical protein
MKQIDIQIVRQAGRQTDRMKQIDIQIVRQTGRQADWKTSRLADRQKGGQADR